MIDDNQDINQFRQNIMYWLTQDNTKRRKSLYGWGRKQIYLFL